MHRREHGNSQIQLAAGSPATGAYHDQPVVRSPPKPSRALARCRRLTFKSNPIVWISALLIRASNIPAAMGIWEEGMETDFAALRQYLEAAWLRARGNDETSKKSARRLTS